MKSTSTGFGFRTVLSEEKGKQRYDIKEALRGARPRRMGVCAEEKAMGTEERGAVYRLRRPSYRP